MATKRQKQLTLAEVEHTAKLANLKLPEKQLRKLHRELETVLAYMSKIQALKTDNTEETHQVTNVVNVLREDKVDKNRMLSQEEALANAKETHDGYFLVEAILDK